MHAVVNNLSLNDRGARWKVRLRIPGAGRGICPLEDCHLAKTHGHLLSLAAAELAECGASPELFCFAGCLLVYVEKTAAFLSR